MRELTAWLLSRTPLRPLRDRLAELTLVLTDDEGIRAVNSAFLGKASPTDVISFTYPPSPRSKLASGEVFVNVERAAQVKPRAPSPELALYIAHGLDHLTGADDATSAQRRVMLKREQEWVTAAGRAGKLAGLLTDERPTSK